MALIFLVKVTNAPSEPEPSTECFESPCRTVFSTKTFNPTSGAFYKRLDVWSNGSQCPNGTRGKDLNDIHGMILHFCEPSKYPSGTTKWFIKFFYFNCLKCKKCTVWPS